MMKKTQNELLNINLINIYTLKNNYFFFNNEINLNFNYNSAFIKLKMLSFRLVILIM